MQYDDRPRFPDSLVIIRSLNIAGSIPRVIGVSQYAHRLVCSQQCLDSYYIADSVHEVQRYRLLNSES